MNRFVHPEQRNHLSLILTILWNSKIMCNMKKRFIHLMALMASFVLLTNCDKDSQLAAGEDNIPDQEILAPAEPMTFNFVADYPALALPVRSEVAVDGKVSWSQEDVVTLYYIENGTPTSTTATVVTVNSENAARAEFSATIPSSVQEVWAAFPAGTGNIDAQGVFTINVTGPFDGSFTSANISAAHASVSEGALLKFKNVIGVFRVELPQGGVISNGDKNYTIGSIMIDSKLGEPAFGGKVTVTADGENNLTFSEPVETTDQVVAQLTEATRGQSYAYLPALPVMCEDGLAVRFVDKDGAAIPAAVTVDGKDVELQRSHIMPVNKAYEGIVWNWYFTPDGTGDGKTESNPADVTTLQDMLNGTDADYCQWRLNGATLHLASGPYTLTEPLVIQSVDAVDIVIEGESKSGSILDGTTVGESGKPMIKMTGAVNLNIKNLTLQNGKATEQGSALQYPDTATGDLSLTNVLFLQNQSTAAAGALLLKGTGLTDIRNCDFKDNTSSAQGGALMIGSTSEVAFTNCSFDSNTSLRANAGGGAIYIGNIATVRIDNCSFENNSAESYGGAIYDSTKAGCKLFINRTSFDSNVLNLASSATNGAAIYTKGNVGLYNCTFHYNHNEVEGKYTTVVEVTKYIMANCTFRESLKYAKGVFHSNATADNLAILCNNVIINTQPYGAFAAADSDHDFATSGYNLMTLASSVSTKINSDQTTYIPADATGRSALSDVFKTIDANNRYYSWGGSVSGFGSYAQPTLAQIETFVKTQANIGIEFWNWLSSISVNGVPSTNVDIRGVARSTDQMWPGSYQQDN